jgi:hypothetical protein
MQIAGVGEAMVVARMQGDRQAMDRLLELNGELDRYHGFRRAQLAAAAEAAPLRLVPPPRALLEASSAADPRQGKFSSPQSAEKSRNQKIFPRLRSVVIAIHLSAAAAKVRALTNM